MQYKILIDGQLRASPVRSTSGGGQTEYLEAVVTNIMDKILSTNACGIVSIPLCAVEG